MAEPRYFANESTRQSLKELSRGDSVEIVDLMAVFESAFHDAIRARRISCPRRARDSTPRATGTDRDPADVEEGADREIDDLEAVFEHICETLNQSQQS
jgi:hypothetical protein